jgi:hypothetical protein
MEKPEPKFEEGTLVYDPEYDETFEFKYRTDWPVQERLIEQPA